MVSQWIPTLLWWCTISSQTQLPVFYPQFTSPVQHEKYQLPERPQKAPIFEIFTPDSLWAPWTSLQFEITPVWPHSLTECSSVETEAGTAPAANTWLGTCLQQVSDGAHEGSSSTKTLTATPAPRVLAIPAGAMGSPRYNNLLSLSRMPALTLTSCCASHCTLWTDFLSIVQNIKVLLSISHYYCCRCKERWPGLFNKHSAKRHQPCSPSLSTTSQASGALEKVPVPIGSAATTDFLVHSVTWPRQIH